MSNGVVQTLARLHQSGSLKNGSDKHLYRPLGHHIPREVEFSYHMAVTVPLSRLMAPHSDRLTSFTSGRGSQTNKEKKAAAAAAAGDVDGGTGAQSLNGSGNGGNDDEDEEEESCISDPEIQSKYQSLWALFFYLCEQLVTKDSLPHKHNSRKKYQILPPEYFAQNAGPFHRGSSGMDGSRSAYDNMHRRAREEEEELMDNPVPPDPADRFRHRAEAAAAAAGARDRGGVGGTAADAVRGNMDEYRGLPAHLPTVMFFCEVIPKLRKSERRVQSDAEMADRNRSYNLADMICILRQNREKYDPVVYEALMVNMESLRDSIGYRQYNRAEQEAENRRAGLMDDHTGVGFDARSSTSVGGIPIHVAASPEESLDNDDFFKGEREVDSVTFHIISNCLFDPGQDLRELLIKNMHDRSAMTNRSLGLSVRSEIHALATSKEVIDEVYTMGAGGAPQIRKKQVTMRTGDQRNEEQLQLDAWNKGYGCIDFEVLCMLHSLYTQSSYCDQQLMCSTPDFSDIDIYHPLHPLNMFSLIYALFNRGRNIPEKQTLPYYHQNMYAPLPPYTNFVREAEHRAVFRFPCPNLVATCVKNQVTLVDIMCSPLPFSRIYADHPLVQKCQSYFANIPELNKFKPEYSTYYMRMLANNDNSEEAIEKDHMMQKAFIDCLTQFAMLHKWKIKTLRDNASLRSIAASGGGSSSSAASRPPVARSLDQLEFHEANTVIRDNMSAFSNPFDLKKLRTLNTCHPDNFDPAQIGMDDVSTMDDFVNSMRSVTETVDKLIRQIEGTKRKRAIRIIHQMFAIMRYGPKRSPDHPNQIAIKAIYRYILETDVYSGKTRPSLPRVSPNLSVIGNFIAIMTILNDSIYQMSNPQLAFYLWHKANNTTNLSFKMHEHGLVHGKPCKTKSHIANFVVNTRVDTKHINRDSKDTRRADESTSAVVTRQTSCALQGKSSTMDCRAYIAHEVPKKMFNSKDEDGGADQWWKEILDSCISRVRRAVLNKMNGQLDTVEVVTYLRIVFIGCINWSLRSVEPAMRQRYTIIEMLDSLNGEDNIPHKMLMENFNSANMEVKHTRQMADRIYREVQCFLTEIEIALAAWMAPVNEAVAYMILSYVNDYLIAVGHKPFHAREISRFISSARRLRLMEIYCEYYEFGGKFYGMDFKTEHIMHMDPMFYITPDNVVTALGMEAPYSFPQGGKELYKVMHHDFLTREKEWFIQNRHRFIQQDDQPELAEMRMRFGYTAEVHPFYHLFGRRKGFMGGNKGGNGMMTNPMNGTSNNGQYAQQGKTNYQYVFSDAYVRQQAQDKLINMQHNQMLSNKQPGQPGQQGQQQMTQAEFQRKQREFEQEARCCNAEQYYKDFREQLEAEFDLNYVCFHVPGGQREILCNQLYKMMEDVPGLKQRPSEDGIYMLLKDMEDSNIVTHPMMLNPERWIPGVTPLVVENTKIPAKSMPIIKVMSDYTILVLYKALLDTTTGMELVKRALQELFDHPTEPHFTSLWTPLNGAYELLELGYGCSPDKPRAGALSRRDEPLLLPNPGKLSEHESAIIKGLTFMPRVGLGNADESKIARERHKEIKPGFRGLMNMYRNSSDMLRLDISLATLAEQMRQEQIFLTPEPITYDDLQDALNSVNQWCNGNYSRDDDIAWQSVRDYFKQDEETGAGSSDGDDPMDGTKRRTFKRTLEANCVPDPEQEEKLQYGNIKPKEPLNSQQAIEDYESRLCGKAPRDLSKKNKAPGQQQQQQLTNGNNNNGQGCTADEEEYDVESESDTASPFRPDETVLAYMQNFQDEMMQTGESPSRYDSFSPRYQDDSASPRSEVGSENDYGADDEPVPTIDKQHQHHGDMMQVDTPDLNKIGAESVVADPDMPRVQIISAKKKTGEITMRKRSCQQNDDSVYSDWEMYGDMPYIIWLQDDKFHRDWWEMTHRPDGTWAPGFGPEPENNGVIIDALTGEPRLDYARKQREDERRQMEAILIPSSSLSTPSPSPYLSSPSNNQKQQQKQKQQQQEQTGPLSIPHWWELFVKKFKRLAARKKRREQLTAGAPAVLPQTIKKIAAGDNEPDDAVAHSESYMEELDRNIAIYKRTPLFDTSTRMSEHLTAEELASLASEEDDRIIMTPKLTRPDIDMDWRHYTVPNPLYNPNEPFDLYINNPRVAIYVVLGMTCEEFKCVMDNPFFTRLRMHANNPLVTSSRFNYPQDIWDLHDRQFAIKQNSRIKTLTVTITSVEPLTSVAMRSIKRSAYRVPRSLSSSSASSSTSRPGGNMVVPAGTMMDVDQEGYTGKGKGKAKAKRGGGTRGANTRSGSDLMELAQLEEEYDRTRRAVGKRFRQNETSSSASASSGLLDSPINKRPRIAIGKGRMQQQ